MGKGTRKLSNRLRALRQTQGGLTQQALADRIGVTRQTIIAIESNKYSPSLEVAFMIAGALGVKIEDVFQYGE